jgi:hypothetical protein
MSSDYARVSMQRMTFAPGNVAIAPFGYDIPRAGRDSDPAVRHRQQKETPCRCFAIPF